MSDYRLDVADEYSHQPTAEIGRVSMLMAGIAGRRLVSGLELAIVLTRVMPRCRCVFTFRMVA